MPIASGPTVAGGTDITSPFVGPVDHTQHVKLDLSTLTTKEVDAASGYLKPGVPIRETGGLGVLVSGSGQVCKGVTVGRTKLNVTVPATDTTLAAETGDHMVAVATHCVINRDIAEDNLTRAYTADEITALDAAFVVLTST